MTTTEQQYKVIGQPVSRVVGRQKVTGAARYTSEIRVPNLAYGTLVTSTIPAGQVKNIDTTEAESLPGVVKVFTHRNFPKTGDVGLYGLVGRGGSTFSPLQTADIRYSNQIVAVVVAETLEIAEYAAALVSVAYEASSAKSDLSRHLEDGKEFLQKERGNVEQGLQQGGVRLDVTYHAPMMFHNPLEPPATVAVWNGIGRNSPQLTLYEPTQSVKALQAYLGHALRMPTEDIRVLSEYVGGGFGVKGTAWFHTPITALVARELGRPVKLLPSREQMYGIWGHRPRCQQQVRLAATPEGLLTAYEVTTHADTSVTDRFGYRAAVESPLMINRSPNARATLRLVPLNFNTPTPMRAPGECEAHLSHSLAMDELAVQLGKDPLEIHEINYADKNYQANVPWTSKELRQCWQRAAERFGWSERNPEPGSMRDGDQRVGWGMSVGAYPVYISPSTAKVRVKRNNQVEVLVCTQSIGTGNYTIIAQTAAEVLGMEVKDVTVSLGDSDLPPGPLTGGARTAASVLPSVKQAAEEAASVLIDMATASPDSPFHQTAPESLLVSGGYVRSSDESKGQETVTQVLDRGKMRYIEGYGEYLPPSAKPSLRNRMIVGAEGTVGPEINERSAYSYNATFVEVKVNPRTGMYQITRVVAAYDAGRILNPKTATSQCKGGIIMGIGYACSEETAIDHRMHRIVNNNFADYHVAVQADVPDIDVILLDVDDPHIGPLGVKGIGEVTICGVPAAIANAIHHATGKRIRHFPILPDKLVTEEA